MSKRRVLTIASCTILLAGCSTAADVRKLPPQTSETIAISADRLSACVYYKLLSDSRVSHIVNTSEGEIVELTGGIDGGGYYRYNWVVSFVPLEPQSTRVEVRSRNTVWGETLAPHDIASSIADCRQ